MTKGPDKDLLVLVADHQMKSAFEGLVSRPEALGIRRLSYDIFVHPERDPGCRDGGPEFLSPFRFQYHHALLMFDREGCGDDRPREQIENDLEEQLRKSDWSGRVAVVVIDPELEAWVWSDSPQLDQAVGWSEQKRPLRQWLQDRGFFMEGQSKPSRPKEALEAVLYHCRRPRSSAIYRDLAERVSFRRCEDKAFNKLRGVLQSWFRICS